MKIARAVCLFAALLAAGCGKHRPRPKTYGAAPPPGRIVYSDPSQAPGISGAVGEVVYLSGGTASWVKSGSADTAWSTFPGSTGAGTVTKAAVRVVSTSNITLSNTQTIDGVSVVAADRVLVAGQSSASDNGIYVVASGAWTRATDFAASTDMAAGTLVPAYAGTSYASTIWQLTTTGAITVGSTALTFAEVSPPSFGSDTNVSLLDSTSTSVTAAELQTTFTSNTHGSDATQFALSLRSAGAAYTNLTCNTTGWTLNSPTATPTITLQQAGSTTGSISWNNPGQLILNATQAAGGVMMQGSGTTLARVNSNFGLQVLGVAFQQAQWTNIASASTIVIPTGSGGGNAGIVSGTTTINLIDEGNWDKGVEVTIQNTGSLTFKHNQAAVSTGVPMMLSGSTDLVSAANCVTKFVLLGTNSGAGPDKWWETSHICP